MILLWGLPGDRPLRAVRRALSDRGVRSVFVDQRQVLGQRLAGARGAVAASLDRVVDLAGVRAAYVRPYDALRVPAVVEASTRGPAVRHALAVTAAIWDWADTTSATVVNRPRAAATNSSKPLQARLLEDAGLRTPQSLLTNDREALATFLATYGAVIYKSTSGVRSTVSRVDPGEPERWDRLATCPTLFQRYLDGDDVRVHVVRDRVFASRVHTDAIDYRRPGDSAVEVEVTTLPADIAAGCVRATAALGLLVSGIDLRHTADGSWYAFEANPSPAFTYYPQADEVAATVADLLDRDPVGDGGLAQ